MSTTFSPLEAELLIDRLGLPDCLAEVLADSEDDELAQKAKWRNGAAVDMACDQLIKRIEACKPVEEIVGQCTPLMRWILKDAVEGSTWLVRRRWASGSPPDPVGTRAANSAVRKLRAAGLDVGEVPSA